MTVKEIQNNLKTILKPARYEHTLGVAKTARHLAERYGYDKDAAELAGLLHDCAKYMDDDTKSHSAGNTRPLSAMQNTRIRLCCMQNVVQFWQNRNIILPILISCMPSVSIPQEFRT